MRVFRVIPAARIGLAVLAVSFTLLACVNVKQHIVRANIARYAAGQDAELDMHVLWECGFKPWAEDRDEFLDYTVDLVNAGWFEGRTRDEIEDLYEPETKSPRVMEADVDGHTRLLLTFDETGRCTGADLT